MSGTHGTEDGVSALTELETKMVDNAGRTIDIDLIDHGFYQEDCRMVGIEAGPMRSNQRPPLMFQEPFTEVDWMRLPDITKPAERISPPPPNSLYEDDLTKKMDIRVANLTYYYKNKNKLIRDFNKVLESNKKILYFNTIPQFKPDIIVVGFCFSLNGDVSWLLRRCGLSASMFLTHDLRIITKNPRLELNHIQKQLLKEIGILYVVVIQDQL